MGKTILHADLNNFYASVECLYNPELRDKAVAVCGAQSTRHGIVLAKNYAAKKAGVVTGEAIWQAKIKCPNLVIIQRNFQRYIKVASIVNRIYKRYTNLVEAFGIDENWLDVTESTRLFGTGEEIANEIKEAIKFEVGITASVGVSYNKIFAKLGSDYKKPDAVTVITEHNYKTIVWPLPVSDLMYVGRSTLRKLNNIGITTIGDLANTPLNVLKNLLGVWGQTLWIFANGCDETPVYKLDYEPVIKGIGNSLTAPRDLVCNEDIKILTYVLAESVGERLRRHHLKGRTVQIWVRDKNLESVERQAKLFRHTNATAEIAEKALDIFVGSWNWKEAIRSYGIRVTDLITADEYVQLSLLDDEKHVKRELLDLSIDKIRGRFGHYSVQRSVLLKDRSLNANPVEENTIHPVSWFR